MKTFRKTLLLAAAVFCAGTMSLSAQGLPSLFGKDGRANSKNRSADIPTTITATTMDIDMGRNLATLLGDVFVDDQEMTIRCEKMLIYFEDKVKEEKKDPEAEEQSAEETTSDTGKDSKEKDKNPAGNKQPVKIECFGDVVIQAKQKEEQAEEQKATAGKAVYDLKKDEITLTESPVIYNGESTVTGTKIIIIVNEERMIVLRAAATTKESLNQ